MSREARISGVPGPGARALLARCLLHGREVPGFLAPTFSGPLVLVVKDQNALEDVADGFEALAPLFGGAAEPIARFGEDERERLGSLETLRKGGRLILAASEALAAPLPAPADFSSRAVEFKAGAKIPRTKALERLAEAGYRRVDFVESPGEFAARGAVLDFYGLQPTKAYRVLYDEDAVAAIRTFEPSTQATQDMVLEARAVPAGGKEGETGTLADWIPEDALWIREDAVAAGPDGDFGALANDPCRGNPAVAWDEMRRRAQAGEKVLLFCLNRGEDSRVQELLEGVIPAGQVQFLVGPLTEGFRHPGLKLAAWSTSEVFERHYRRVSRWKYFTAVARGGLSFRELKEGDFVVHQDYGVSRYRGLTPVESPGHGVLDCLKLEFRGSDSLYVPMYDFGRVQRYSGAEGKRPRLSSLDTRRWEEIKRQVHEGVRELAEQLLKTQAARASLPGHAFPPETPMEREFAESFPFEETEDQAAAIRAVLDDMMSPLPMDRLVIGDVGFGKTEVAMRAVFKCAAGFKQALILVPTTILADQHYRTFSSRMADYPVKLGLLTRFQTPKEQAAVLKGLREGAIDAVIGTARLLQKDVAVKDLGLLVIDEEHRFGVKDKERFKSLRKSVDCLALSATPIPRTLNQALSGLRGLSLIESAPTGRLPIVSEVGPWDENVVAHAINEELARGGQAYYVHNRVRTLGDCVETLKKLLPGVRFGMVHGQMKGRQIEDAMWRFFQGDFDVLVASTIIESGLDIPTVNTLIVEDAHEFGLAQLYQLRGRIGRERRRAHCYLFFPESHGDVSALSEEARKRLEALREFTHLGSGVKLAMRDLEIRGAGELLGARQHGFINAVGADFYSQLLDEEVARLKGQAAAAPEQVQLDIKLPAYIPEAYLPDEMERLDFYKRILKAEVSEAAELRKRLEDLSGPAPEPVDNLFALMRVRAVALKAGARLVTQKGGHIEVYFRPGAPIDARTLSWWENAYKGRLRFLRGDQGDGVTVDLADEEPLKWLEDFLAGVLRGHHT